MMEEWLPKAISLLCKSSSNTRDEESIIVRWVRRFTADLHQPCVPLAIVVPVTDGYRAWGKRFLLPAIG